MGKGIKTGRRETEDRQLKGNTRRAEEDFRWRDSGDEEWETELEERSIRNSANEPDADEAGTSKETWGIREESGNDRDRRHSNSKTARKQIEIDHAEYPPRDAWAEEDAWEDLEREDLEEELEEDLEEAPEKTLEDLDPEDNLEFEGDTDRRFRQEEPRRRKKQPKPTGIRVRNAIVTVLLSVVILITIGAVAFLFLQISGKNSLYSRADSSTLVSTLSEMAVVLGEEARSQDGSLETVPEDDMGNWQEGDIRYQGIHYRYNADILTFLFLGIDKMEEVKPVESGIDGGQSDALFLLVLDPHKKKASIIGIPRDTMAEIEVYDSNGDFQWTTEAQITLQHGYGDGGKLSCERSMNAVSKLFYGLPINGYCAINMGAIPVINDAVGGISLTALETLDFGNFRVKEGEPLHLKGMDAYHYIHNRDTASFNSAGRRLQRQVQYLEAYAAAALETFKNDITFPVTLYGELSKYMVTDISVDEVGYLATQVAGYGFSKEDMHTLEGETTMGAQFEEFRVDETSLYKLIINVFYEEVE